MKNYNITSTSALVLSELRSRNGQYVSGEELAKQCGVSRTAIWKAIASLRDSGYEISASTRTGYCLHSEPDILNSAEIACLLKEYEKQSHTVMPQMEQIHTYDTIDSTNTAAKTAIAACTTLRSADGVLTADGQKLHKSVFCANQQTAGKGRQGRQFYSPPSSGLYISIVYAPAGGITNPAIVTAGAAVAACRAILEIYHIECQIKWVNDIYLNGKKVCGILTEGMLSMETNLLESAIIGTGFNLKETGEGFPPDIAQTAGTLLGKNPEVSTERNKLAAAATYHLLHILETKERIRQALCEYRKRSMLIGKELTIYPLAGAFPETERKFFTATAVDINDEAQLIVQLPEGKKISLDSGEVTLHGSVF